MNSYLKHYKIKIHTLGPVFIGSGETVKKSEYVYDKNKAYFIDVKKLMQQVVARGLVSNYTEAVKNFRNFNINNWLQRNGIYDYQSISSYTLDCKEEIDDRNGIQTFIKNAYNEPYIPGSSLKGAIRTIILWNELLNKTRPEVSDFSGKLKKAMQEEKVKKPLGRVSKEIENAIFTEKIEDKDVSIMRGLIISDSKPLSCSDLVLCKKIDIGTKRTEKKLNIMRECIAPGKTIEFDVTIDESIFKYSLEDIKEMLENYSNDYFENVTSHFDRNAVNDNSIFIGGGAGYFSKTVTYGGALFSNHEATVDFVRNFLARTTPREHKHQSDRIISPHMQKCTKIGEKIYEMGKCVVEIAGE